MPAAPRPRVPPVALFLIASGAAAVVVALAYGSGADWWALLRKPAWAAPFWLAALGWLLFYTAAALAAWRVWRKTDDLGARRTFRLFRAQLALSALWAILVFVARRPDWGLLDLTAWWAALVMITVWFWRVERLAGMLSAASLAWVTYQFALTAALWNMNR